VGARCPTLSNVPDAPPAAPSADPQAPLGHLSRLGYALVGASGIDEVAASLLTSLTALPGVRRVGFALSEGGGRRLRFTASDRSSNGSVDWCHIDAYDDVPLTRVVRTGEPVMGHRDSLGSRFGEFVAGQPTEVRALAAVPLPGIGSPIGGLVFFLEDEWDFDEAQRGLLEATARRVADAVRRLRVDGQALHDDEPGHDDATRGARIVLSDDPRAARDARRFLRDFLARDGVSEDLAATAELCLSELVTNSIVHAGGRIEVRATVDSSLTVSVRDRGGPAPDAAPDDDPDPLRVHGRGLQLVEALADRWGSERDAIGSRVWFSLELDPAEA
jgi:anti-sigma regulatory factor (Ser/Thr protein kinase)